MTSKPCKCRYDARGKKILPHQDMLLYYKDDAKSLNIVHRYMPFRYICIPHIQIRISPTTPPIINLYLIYPGEAEEREIKPSVRIIEGLRATYRGKPGWDRSKGKNGDVVLSRAGRVILDPLRRYGIKA